MRRQTGVIGERVAREYLQARGMQHIASNVRYPQGEIDLVMLDGDTIVFCEVKARAHGARHSALAAVTPAKQRRICQCALMFLRQRGLMGRNVRFDAVAVDGFAEKITVDHVKSAFEFQSPRYFV